MVDRQTLGTIRDLAAMPASIRKAESEIEEGNEGFGYAFLWIVSERLKRVLDDLGGGTSPTQTELDIFNRVFDAATDHVVAQRLTP